MKHSWRRQRKRRWLQLLAWLRYLFRSLLANIYRLIDWIVDWAVESWVQCMFAFALFILFLLIMQKAQELLPRDIPIDKEGFPAQVGNRN